MHSQGSRGSSPRPSLAAAAAAAGLLLLATGCTEPTRDPAPPVAAVPSRNTAPPPVTTYGIDEVQPAKFTPPAVAASLPEAGAPPMTAAETGAAAVASFMVPGLDIAPGDGGDHLGLGQRLYSQGDFLKSAAHLAVALEEDPSSWFTSYLLGLSLWKAGDLAGARTMLERSSTVHGSFLKTHINLARVLNEMGEYPAALASAERAVDLDPTSSDALHLQGRSLANLGRHSEAITALRASIVQEPDNGHARNRLGLLYLTLGRHQEAVAELEPAVALLPELGYVHNNLGLSYERSGRREDALAQFTLGLAADPENPRLRASLDRLDRPSAEAVVQLQP